MATEGNVSRNPQKQSRSFPLPAVMTGQNSYSLKLWRMVFTVWNMYLWFLTTFKIEPQKVMYPRTHKSNWRPLPVAILSRHSYSLKNYSMVFFVWNMYLWFLTGIPLFPLRCKNLTPTELNNMNLSRHLAS